MLLVVIAQSCKLPREISSLLKENSLLPAYQMKNIIRKMPKKKENAYAKNEITLQGQSQGVFIPHECSYG